MRPTRPPPPRPLQGALRRRHSSRLMRPTHPPPQARRWRSRATATRCGRCAQRRGSGWRPMRTGSPSMPSSRGSTSGCPRYQHALLLSHRVNTGVRVPCSPSSPSSSFSSSYFSSYSSSFSFSYSTSHPPSHSSSSHPPPLGNASRLLSACGPLFGPGVHGPFFA